MQEGVSRLSEFPWNPYQTLGDRRGLSSDSALRSLHVTRRLKSAIESEQGRGALAVSKNLRGSLNGMLDGG